MLSVIMLSVIMLSVIMLSVIMRSVVVPLGGLNFHRHCTVNYGHLDLIDVKTGPML
jgi:hypothetical protein